MRLMFDRILVIKIFFAWVQPSSVRTQPPGCHKMGSQRAEWDRRPSPRSSHRTASPASSSWQGNPFHSGVVGALRRGVNRYRLIQFE